MAHSSSDLGLRSLRHAVAAVAMLLGVIGVAGLSATPAAAEGATGSITGHVTDIGGNPLGGKYVEVFQAVYVPGFVPRTAYTLADGTYSVNDIPVGDYNVRFSAEGYSTEYYDDVSDGSPTVVPVAAGQATAGIDAALSPMHQISGTVTDRDGIPISGLRVGVYDLSSGVVSFPEAVTGIDGTYHVYLEPGDYQLRFHLSFSSAITDWWAPQWWNDATTQSASQVVSLGADDITGLDALLDVAGVVTGTVYDTAGQPVPNAYINLFDEIGFVNVVAADSMGVYTINGAGTGPHRIVAGNNPSFGSLGQTNVDTVAAQTSAGVDVVIAPPVGAVLDLSRTDEDTAVVIDVLANDANAVVSTLSISEAPSHGGATIVDGTVLYEPDADAYGLDEFEYEICGLPSDCVTASVFVTVTPVDDAPIAGSDSWTGAEFEELTVAAPGVLANDSDVESSAVTAMLASAPTKGEVVLEADGSFVYVPTTDTCGVDSFTYRANDGFLLSAPATVTLTIACAPEFTGTIEQAGTLRDILEASDYSPAQDADTLRLYRAFFDRDPDIGGIRYWLSLSREGVNYDTMSWSFANSEEFRLTYGDVPDQRFLEIVYRNVLGRTPDPDGFDYWLDQMENGLPRHLVVRWVAAGMEFENRFPYSAR